MSEPLVPEKDTLAEGEEATCCCGSALDGSHDHNSCGPPIVAVRKRVQNKANEKERSMKCYVGNWDYRPMGVAILPCWHACGTCHPRDFQIMIDALAAESPDLSLWSNNPYVVDCFKPADVMVCNLRKDGKVVSRPLTDHPQFQVWKNKMMSGEMWSVFGEGWVTE